MAKIVALNLGCGRDYRKNWTNIDNQCMYDGDFKVDIVTDIVDLTWQDNTVDFILLNHVVQYFQPSILETLLIRWLKWLKPGGSLYIEAGDVIKVCHKIVRAKTIDELHSKDALMQLYGTDNDIWNKWAWCPASMTALMDRVGFKYLFTGLGYFHHNPSRDFLTVGYKEGGNFPSSIPELITV